MKGMQDVALTLDLIYDENKWLSGFCGEPVCQVNVIYFYFIRECVCCCLYITSLLNRCISEAPAKTIISYRFDSEYVQYFVLLMWIAL